MGFTALERMFFTERLQRRAANHSTPLLHERSFDEKAGPFLVTNMRGDFVPTKRSSQGIVRCGFYPGTPEEDELLLGRLYQSILARTTDFRCSTVAEATGRVQSAGFAPRTVVLPASSIQAVCQVDPEEAWVIMGRQGYVTRVEETQILVSKTLPEGAALVATAPAMAGIYVRAGDYVGVMACLADRALVAVAP